MSKYQTEKVYDPRQIDVEEYIKNKGGYTPGPRQAAASGVDGQGIGTQQEYLTIAKLYAPLRSVLDAAYSQASVGKGKERHANDRPFMQQPIMEITRMHGLGFVTGQASKKAQEAIGMMGRGQHGAAERELLGAIVYLAAAALRVREEAVEFQARKVADESGVDKDTQAG